MASTFVSLLAFAAIVALIPLALWLLKRTPIGGGAAHGVMRTVAMLPISANQRLLTVEVGSGDDRKWLVIGVSNAGIQTLHTMAPQALTATATPHNPFAQLLARHLPGAQHKSGDSFDAR
ncbi:MAG TPA: flagellar biosynthetic protein FliO [Burkholderiaceae bacterium]|nr:flagellar biosynthetic protein FliO [Burkholderiaceae bacterium]